MRHSSQLSNFIEQDQILFVSGQCCENQDGLIQRFFNNNGNYLPNPTPFEL